MSQHSSNCAPHLDGVHLLGGLLVLPEEVVEDSAVLLVNSLHLIDVLSNLLHHNQRLCQSHAPKLTFIRT